MGCKYNCFFNFFNFKKSEKISSEVLKSKLPVGSSAKISLVSAIKALAIAILCCSPPESSLGKWFDSLKIFTCFKIFSAFFEIIFLFSPSYY